MIEDVGVARKAPRTAHHRNAFPLASCRFSRISLSWVEFDVIAHEQVKVRISVVIEESAACTPANHFVVKSGFASYVPESPVSVVVEQYVVSPKTTEQIVPAVVVIVANASAGLPASLSKTGFLRNVREGTVAIILKQLRSRRFPRRPLLCQSSSVR